MVAQAKRLPGLMYWFPSSSSWYSGLTWTTIERPIILRIPWSLIKLSSGFSRALQLAIKNELFNVKMKYIRTDLNWLKLIEYTKSGQIDKKWSQLTYTGPVDQYWSKYGLNMFQTKSECGSKWNLNVNLMWSESTLNGECNLVESSWRDRKWFL